jgi:ATP-dependent protease ClpP protease subunit
MKFNFVAHFIKVSKDFNIKAEINNRFLNLSIVGRIYQGEVARALKSEIDSAVTIGISGAEIYINSEGGSVFEAQEVVNELRRLPNVKIKVGALAASAATYILCHFDAECYASSQFMIHKPTSQFFGNEDELTSELKSLTNLTKIYRTAYAKKFGKTEAQIEKMWANDYWMNSQEALNLGLISSITDKEIELDEESLKMMVACKCPNIPEKQNFKINNMSNLALLAVALALPTTATETDITAGINKLKTDKQTAEDNEKAWKDKYNALVKKDAEAVISEAVSLGLIPEGIKENQIEAFVSNPENQREVYAKMIKDKKETDEKEGKQRNLYQALGTVTKGRSNAEVTFDWLQKNDVKELQRLRDEQPEVYAKLAKDYAAGVRDVNYKN